MELRAGEVTVQCAGGVCAVCRGRIIPGQAVQLSSYTCRLRHQECMPVTDRRHRQADRRRAKPFDRLRF